MYAAIYNKARLYRLVIFVFVLCFPLCCFSGVVWDRIYGFFESRYQQFISLPVADVLVHNFIQDCAHKVQFDGHIDVRIGNFRGFEACHFDWQGHCLIVLSPYVHGLLQKFCLTGFSSSDVVMCQHVVRHEIGHLYHKHLRSFFGLYKKFCSIVPDFVLGLFLKKESFLRQAGEFVLEFPAFLALAIPAYILKGRQEVQADSFALHCSVSERELHVIKKFFKDVDMGYWREWLKRITFQDCHPTSYDRAQAVQSRINQLL